MQDLRRHRRRRTAWPWVALVGLAALLGVSLMAAAIDTAQPDGSADAGPKPAVGTIRGTIQVGSPEHLGDVVVFVLGESLERTVPKHAPAIDQRNRTFVPSLLVVPVGTEVQFPNSDLVAHNVFSTSRPATFDLGLYSGGDSRSYVMESPGVVNVFCNVHPEMAAIVLVVENDYHASPGGNGEYVIEGVPVGKHDVVAWMAWGERVIKTVEVTAGGEVVFDANLGSPTQSTRHLNKDGESYGAYK